MTAPTDPAPLPVWVRLVNVEVGDDGRTPVLDGDGLPMLMPDADSRTVEAALCPLDLFNDGLFIVRVIQRLADSYGHVAPSMMIEFLNAITAELRERAGE